MSYQIVMKNDELYHWKYLDKYKKNGKWVYIYDEAKDRVNSGIKNAKSVIKKKKRRVTKDFNKFKKNTAKSYNNFKKDASRKWDNTKKKVSTAATKAYEKAKPVIREVARKTLSAVKALIEKGRKAFQKVADYLFGTSTTDSTLRTVTRPDAGPVKLTGKNRGKGPSNRVVKVRNTTVSDGVITKLVRKGKKAFSGALGKNTNTYRVDRPR